MSTVDLVCTPVTFERDYTRDDPGMWVLRAHDHSNGEHWVNRFAAVSLEELVDVVFDWIEGGAPRLFYPRLPGTVAAESDVDK